MQAASRESLEAVQATFDAQVNGLDADAIGTLADDLAAVAKLLLGEVVLRTWQTAHVMKRRRGALAGDGAGIMIQVPDRFLRETVDFELPAEGSYATGIAFLPQGSEDARLACEGVEKVIEAERDAGHPIDAVLATLGGQTALNTAVALHDRGSLEKYGIELIGADFDAIQRGEDRQMFKDIVEKVGGESARSRVCHTMDEVRDTVAELGFPVVVRPSFTMGGLGSGMAYDDEDLDRIAGGGLAASPTANVLIEESILGWKEYELELMRDNRDNVVVVCSIENLDPVGVHTGDSVTVAPAMTLTDREYQIMRDLSIDILREVGVDVVLADAQRLGIADQQLVWVSSRRGKVITRADISDRINEGAVYMTYQWWVGACNELTQDNLDPISKTPETKYCAVKVEAIADQRWAEQYAWTSYSEMKARLKAAVNV